MSMLFTVLAFSGDITILNIIFYFLGYVYYENDVYKCFCVCFHIILPSRYYHHHHHHQ